MIISLREIVAKSLFEIEHNLYDYFKFRDRQRRRQ